MTNDDDPSEMFSRFFAETKVAMLNYIEKQADKLVSVFSENLVGRGSSSLVFLVLILISWVATGTLQIKKNNPASEILYITIPQGQKITLEGKLPAGYAIVIK